MLTMADIIRDGHPTLREVAKPVEFPLSQEDRAIAESLMEYVLNSQDDEIAEKYGLRPGVGLAAPQINVNKRMTACFAEDYSDQEGKTLPPLIDEIFINPRIISHSVEKIALREGEGCLSVDVDHPGYVPRYARVTVEYQDLNGEKHKKRFKGYAAIIIQHEIDHLNGILFYDHINESDPFSLGEHEYLIGEEF